MGRDIILASGSPRRKEILEQAGLSFTVMPSQVEEETDETEPSRMVEALSRQKAEDVYSRLPEETQRAGVVVLAADTVVARDGQILGKPADEKEAFAMLMSLCGTVHQVYTGVTMLAWDGEETFCEETAVEFLDAEPEQIRAYIATGEPMDKAGGYGIQSPISARFIRGIHGDYWNVVGLPIGEVLRRLQKRNW